MSICEINIKKSGIGHQIFKIQEEFQNHIYSYHWPAIFIWLIYSMVEKKHLVSFTRICYEQGFLQQSSKFINTSYIRTSLRHIQFETLL